MTRRHRLVENLRIRKRSQNKERCRRKPVLQCKIDGHPHLLFRLVQKTQDEKSPDGNLLPCSIIDRLPGLRQIQFLLHFLLYLRRTRFNGINNPVSPHLHQNIDQIIRHPVRPQSVGKAEV